MWRFFRKLKIGLPYDLALPILGIYPKATKSAYQRDACPLVVIAALFTTAKIWNQFINR
jgi:hypothetical protein